MLKDYLLKNVRIGKVADGKRNAGNYYLTCEVKVADPRFRNVKGEQETIWYDEDPELIDTVRSVLPANGNDPQGNPWNGLNTDITTFGITEYNAAMKALQNMDGTNWLLRANCKYINYVFGAPMCMKFATDLVGNGTAEAPQFHKGDFVKDQSGSYVKVYDHMRILVQMFDEATEDYCNGMDPDTRIKNKMRNMVPLAAVIAAGKEPVHPMYTSEYVVPTVKPEQSGEAPGEAPNENR